MRPLASRWPAIRPFLSQPTPSRPSVCFKGAELCFRPAGNSAKSFRGRCNAIKERRGRGLAIKASDAVNWKKRRKKKKIYFSASGRGYHPPWFSLCAGPLTNTRPIWYRGFFLSRDGLLLFLGWTRDALCWGDTGGWARTTLIRRERLVGLILLNILLEKIC